MKRPWFNGGTVELGWPQKTMRAGIARLSLTAWLFLMMIILVSAGHHNPVLAGSVARPRGQDGAESAETAIRLSYEALGTTGSISFPDSVEPAARPGQGPDSALSVVFGLSQLAADTVVRLAFVDMRYERIRSSGVWAEVRVRGLIRNATLGTEIPLDVIEIAHRLDGRWYTSLPELYVQTPAGQDYAARIRKLNAEGCH